MNIKTATVLSVCLFLRCFGLSHAAQEAIEIQADFVDLRRSENTALYSGNVRLKQNQFTLQADTVKARLKNNDIGHISASGKPVRASIHTGGKDGRISASALRLEFDQRENEIHMYDNAVLTKGGSVIRAAVIEYNLRTQQLRAFGSGQNNAVTVTLPAAK